MKKNMARFSVFTLLLSLLLSLVSPVPAAAEQNDVTFFDKESKMIFYNGQGCAIHSDAVSLIEQGYLVAYFFRGSSLYLYLFPSDLYELSVYESGNYFFFPLYNGNLVTISEASDHSSVCAFIYSVNKTTGAITYNSKSQGFSNVFTSNSSSSYYDEFGNKISHVFGSKLNVLYSDLNLYNAEVSSSKVVSVSNDFYYASDIGVSPVYAFYRWCNDAGLNYTLTNGSLSLPAPQGYVYIVRRSSTDKYGRWFLTTIGNSQFVDDYGDYTVLLSDDFSQLMVFNLYSGEVEEGYILDVRQYEYDTNGWRLRNYNYYDAREDEDYYIELGSGTGTTEPYVLAYTNVNIYDTSFNELYTASTEFVDVNDIIPDTPIISPTPIPSPTPTTAPSGGDSGNNSSGGGRPGSGTRPDTGGQATGGGGLDFIINLFTMIWTKICSVPMAVDGYSINLQQIVIYGALVSIVGGFIMHFIFGRK